MTSPHGNEPDALNDLLVDKLARDGIVCSPAIAQAFRNVPRHHFLPHLPPQAVYQDEAIMTHQRDGSEEWISSSSQPAMMAIMLEQLQVAPGQRVLEVGAGTGYNAALLAELTGRAENVWTVDVEEEFCAEARTHLAAAGKAGIYVVCADGWEGWPAAAPYDRVIVTASAYDIAPAWLEQLREGGVIVLPWGPPQGMQRSLGLRKRDGHLVQQSGHSCGFMKMRGVREWQDTLAPLDTQESVERPWSTSPSPVSGIALDHLAFFLSVFLWPLVPVVYWQGDPPAPPDVSQDRKLGLRDSSRRIVATVEMGTPWKTIGLWDEKTADALETFTHLWQQWGKPTPDQVHLTAYPLGSAPTPGDGDTWARREWFDYLVLRLGTITP